MASLYKAYFDESGTHETSDAVAVAGFVSNVTNWEKFSVEWQKALCDYGLDFFHMSDFESRHGQFKSWGDQRRKDCLNRFLALITDHDYIFSSIGCVIPKKSFDSIFSASASAVCGGAYGLAAIACFDSLRNVASHPKVDGWMEYVLESGAKGRDAITRHYHEKKKTPKYLDATRILSLSFRDKRELPLQASDILAYELCKHVPRQLGLVEKRPDRYPLLRLNTMLNEWHYLNYAELQRLSQELT